MLGYKDVIRRMLIQLTKEPYDEDVDICYCPEGVTNVAILRLKKQGYMLYIQTPNEKGISPVIIICDLKKGVADIEKVIRDKYPNYVVA